MYPNTYFNLFPPFPRNNDVFVIMSFDDRFTSRWTDVIAPALASIHVNDTPLRPHRVDARQIGDSILTEILTGISNSRLVFADITELGKVDGRSVRNGNVMYEVGLAHSRRVPEEVLLFRSDSARLLFDVAHVRVHSYNPESDPSGSIEKVVTVGLEALREIDLQRHLTVKQASEALDDDALNALADIAQAAKYTMDSPGGPGGVIGRQLRLAQIRRLLDLGLIATTYTPTDAEAVERFAKKEKVDMAHYEATELGKVVLSNIASRLKPRDASVQQRLQAVARERLESRQDKGDQ